MREPLLGIQPIMPPLPALPMPPMQPGGDVEVRRKTKIQGPKGVLGRFHDWFHDACFGPAQPQAATPPRRGLFGVFHPAPSDGEVPTRQFNWPAWPSWPLADRR